MMADVVYILCAVTSVLCAVMLGRAYRRSRVRMLLWSTWCFTGLALNNVLLLVDRFTPSVDLVVLRGIPALLGALLLIWGLVRDTT